MPLYDFINSETGEMFEEMMSISESDKFLEDNPHIRKYFGSNSINFMDEYSLGRRKPTTAFFDRLDTIKKNNPGNTMGTSRFEKPRSW